MASSSTSVELHFQGHYFLPATLFFLQFPLLLIHVNCPKGYHRDEVAVQVTALLCILILAKWGMPKGQTAPVNSYSHLSSWACSPFPVLTAKEPYCGHSDYQVKLVTKIWACGKLPLPLALWITWSLAIPSQRHKSGHRRCINGWLCYNRRCSCALKPNFI